MTPEHKVRELVGILFVLDEWTDPDGRNINLGTLWRLAAGFCINKFFLVNRAAFSSLLYGNPRHFEHGAA